MIVRDLINYMIPTLKPSESVDKAIEWMKELQLSELPVVENGRYLGLFSEQLILGTESNSTVSEYELLGSTLFLNSNEHYYELLKKASEQDLRLVAVVGEDNKYIGTVAITDVIVAFSKMSSINSTGAIIILSISMIDYSMTEISRIIESEGGKILSSFIEESPEENGKINLTIKLNIENASTIASTLERFGYHINSKYGFADDLNVEQERFDSLIKYLEV